MSDDDSMFVPKRLAAIRIKLLSPTAKAPQYMTAGAAGADVFADFGGIVDDPGAQFGDSFRGASVKRDRVGDGSALDMRVTLRGGTVKIPLGFAIEIPSGWVGLIKGRSGLASKGHECHVAAIDPDYRGEVGMLIHVGPESLIIRHGDRVGQILFVPSPQFDLVVGDDLSETVRNTGGFGSTGSR